MTDPVYVDVPQHVPNDEAALLVEWQAADGTWVESDQILCLLEFSKATFDLPAPVAGYLFHLKQAGEEVRVGSPLGVISQVNARLRLVAHTPAAVSPGGSGTPSRKAAELMAAHGLTVNDFPGIDLIREHHVAAVIESKGAARAISPEAVGEPATLRRHTPRQRRLIRTISQSHRTIPHSWISVALDGALLAERTRLAAEAEGSIVSLTDLTIWAVSQAAVAHHAMNAGFGENETRLYESVNVGIAMNMPNGDLVVPVIRDASSLGVRQIAARARQMQKKAIRGTLTAEDMHGGTVTVTSLAGSGMTQVNAIIMPGQSFILAIGDPVRVQGVHLQFITAGFDHRVMNGSEAAACLATIGRLLCGEPTATTN